MCSYLFYCCLLPVTSYCKLNLRRKKCCLLLLLGALSVFLMVHTEDQIAEFTLTPPSPPNYIFDVLK